MIRESLFVDLDHDDVMKLVTSSSPEPDKIKAYIKKGYGSWTGEFDDEFMWKYHVINKMDIEDLYRLYLCMKFNKPLCV